MKVSTSELRQKYLDFFASKDHVVIDGASVIPENDPTVLFTTAGMQPLVPYLLGEKHPAGNRVVNVQKCIRTVDIDEVGDDTHLTFFEMLGNWSFGDYFKKESIHYSWEFLTAKKWLAIPAELLAVSVFEGDEHAQRDEESAEYWKDLGVPITRIAYLGKQDNWWGPAGQTGPCGPDTEIFYWTGSESAPEVFDPEDERWVEIWNNVFMQYNKTAEGGYEPLQQKNVDTGMGFERVVAVLNGFSNVYEIDNLAPIVELVRSKAEEKNNEKAIRIISDHIRAAVYIMGDDQGVGPSNLDQGYVVRRLIRSAIRRGREIGIADSFIGELAEKVIALGQDFYTELDRNKQRVLSELTVEEEKFKKTLISGTKEALSLMENNFNEFLKSQGKEGMQAHDYKPGETITITNPLITGKEAFYLYSTYGIPKEIIQELADKYHFVLDEDEFNAELVKHQELSRKGSEQKFAGGLADHSEETTKLHTATHLLHTALRQVLGDHVAQKGSNITKDRLRFDFSHPDKLTDEEKQQVEQIVNNQIKAALPVYCEEMSVDEAKAKGAIGLFTHKYGDKINVYTVGDQAHPFSREICGGPHVHNTSELGTFRIKKEQASSSGVRRIKAVLE